MMTFDNVVRDKYGKIINRSANLAGVRRYIGKTRSPIKVLDVSRLTHGGGQLGILWEDGASYQTAFADFSVMCDFVSRWRNAHGAPLTYNGKPVSESSVVDKHWPARLSV